MAGWTNLTPSGGAPATGNAYLYESSGALTYRGTSGSATTLVNADGTVPGGVWQDVASPTYTGFVKGTGGTFDYRYTQVGKTVSVYGKFVYGTGSSVSGNPSIDLPVAAANAFQQPSLSAMSVGGSNYIGISLINSTTAFFISVMNASSTYAGRTGISSTVPATWNAGSYFTFAFSYEAA